MKSKGHLYISNPDSRKSKGRRSKRLPILLLTVLILLGMRVDAALAQVADLQVTKTVNDSTPNESQLITYTINVRNNGPDDATGVTILDLLPAGISFDSIDTIQPTGATYDPITGIWDIGTIPEGTNYNLKLDVRSDVGTAGSTIANTTSVASLNETDPISSNDSATVDVTVNPVDLIVTKSVNDTTPDEGQTITFTIRARNDGPGGTAATNVVITDLLPAGLILVSATPEQGSYDSGTGIWTVGTINEGQDFDLIIVVTVDTGTSGTTITNTASVDSVDQMDTNPANDAASIDVLVNSADIQITKSVNDTTPNEGQTLTYRVNVRNLGPSFTTNVLVEDILPTGLTFVSAAPGQGSYDSGTGIWTVGTINSGQNFDLDIVVTVDTGTSGTTITNTASVDSVDQMDTNPANDSASAPATVNGADLQISKNVNDIAPDEGQTVTFTINVRNNGPATATNIIIGDLLSPTLTFVSAVPDQGAYNEVTGEWSVGTMTSGQNFNLQIVATINPGTSGTSIGNTVRVNSVDQADGDLTNNSATVEMLVNSPDLEVTKSVNDSSPDEGQAIRYTIEVENRGPAQATGIEITDLLPAGVTFVSINLIEQGTYDDTTGLWILGTLDAGQKRKLEIDVTVNVDTAGQTITNRAQVSNLTQTDGDISNNSASVDIFINGADLAVTKTVDNVVPLEGDTIVYTIRVDNNGPLNANNITIEDILPAGVTYVSAVESQGDPYGDTVPGEWFANDINVGGFATLEITATVDAGTTGSAIVNTALVTSVDELDSITDNNSADGALIVIGEADPEISKSVNVTRADEGDPVTYTITVTNNGPDPAAAFVVNDPLPTGITYVSHSTTPETGAGSYDPVTGTWDYGVHTLANGASATLTVNATVDAGTAAQTIINTATLVTVERGNDPSNDVASANFQVSGADIAVTKTIDNDRPADGAEYTYTITVTNNGPDNATGVEVTDSLPYNVNYVSDTPSQGSYDNITGIWSVSSLSVGASATLDIVATTTITSVNTATKTAADQPDSATANDSASVSVTASTNFGAGSCIIDMGVGVEQPDPNNPTIFQGYDKGLEPYSLIYELIRTYRVPVYWAINPDKTGFMPPPEAGADYTSYASALDFTADGKNYYGSSFIVPVAFITPEVQTLLDTWDPDGNGLGPTVDCPATDFSAPIYNTVTTFPRAVLDEANGDKIETAFYDESGVPADSYQIGSPEDLTLCHDIHALPHADPQSWPDSYHSAFQDYINGGGAMWSACHAVSALETLTDTPPADGVNDFNLLSNRGLVPWGEHNDGTPINGDPTDYRYETALGADSLLQVVSSFDGSLQDGSEQVYLPLLDPINTNTGELPTITDDPLDRPGGWRDTTTVAVWDPGHPDVENADASKIISPGKAALVAYGRAYGDDSLGLIVYEASHTVAGGSEYENTSAARVYGNLLLQVGIERRPNINLQLSVEEVRVGDSIDITSNIVGGTPPFTYEWTDSCGGTFTPSISDPSLTYTPPSDLTESTSCVVRLILTDTCFRRNFEARVIPVNLPSISGSVFEDADGLTNGAVDGNGIGTVSGSQLYVNLIDESNNVVAVASVNVDGSYQLDNIPINSTYTIQLSTNQGTVGSSAPPVALPSDWVNSGEDYGSSNGAGSGVDAVVDGSIRVIVDTNDDITAVNFGLFHPPVVGNDSSLDNNLGSAVTIDILANDLLADGTTPSPEDVTVDLDPDTPGVQTTLVVPNEGTWEYNPATGEVTFTPESSDVYYPTPIEYTSTENATGLSTTGTITITYDLTLVLISAFGAYTENGRVVVAWQTASENGTIGFHLERLNEKRGKYQRINKKLLPGLLVSPEGGTYRFVDRKAHLGNTYIYQLVEKEANGNRRIYGPYKVTVDDPHFNSRYSADETSESVDVTGDRLERQAKKRPNRVKPARREPNRELMVATIPAAKQPMGEAALGVNISVSAKGVYHLSAMIDKIMAYEASSGAWKNQVLMVADNTDGGGNFPVDSDAVATLISEGYTADSIHLGTLGLAAARQALSSGFEDGAFLVNYIGHSGLDRLADEGLWTLPDVAGMTNQDHLPILVGMTCVAGRFEIPGYDAIAESLVVKADGGAVAAWAPTGLSLNSLARVLDEGFFTAVFSDNQTVLGDAILSALIAYKDEHPIGNQFMLDIYNLIGDPALELR